MGGRTPTAWQELNQVLFSIPSLDSSSRRRLSHVFTRSGRQHARTHSRRHVKIEADEMECLTQSRKPRGSIVSRSYYSVYYIYIGTAAAKSRTQPTT